MSAALRHDPAWHDAQYNMRAAVPDHAAVFAHWAASGRAARAPGVAPRARLDLGYGPGAAEHLDLFPAGAAPDAPLLVFLHGGYWRAMDKADFSWLAAPYNQRGIAVAVVNYGLAPATALEDIVRQCLRASDWLWRNAGALGYSRERMVVAGHSAGGHLGAMLLCAQWARWSSDLPARVYRGAVLISGLYDLDPIMRTPFLNVDLGLTPERVAALSPLYLTPATTVPVITAVGARETAEFKRQTREYQAAWPALQRAHVSGARDDHFRICQRLGEPDHELFRRTAELCLGT